MAAGLATRFGGPKQLTPVGPSGEALLDYTIVDAVRAGFDHVVMVTRHELERELRSHVGEVFGSETSIAWVNQRLDDLPAGFVPPPGRVKPWGTAQALLAARGVVSGPCAVCNADDYYGPGALRLLAEHLRRHAAARPPLHAIAGYRLDRTLSPHGGVARAVATVDDRGGLDHLIEVMELRAESSGLISGRSVHGGHLSFTGEELVSMNLWGFEPAVFEVLAAQFEAFLEAHGRTMDAECRLSDAVAEQVARGQARVQVLAAPDRWFGMTYAADLEEARRSIRTLVEAGVYPPDLRNTGGVAGEPRFRGLGKRAPPN